MWNSNPSLLGSPLVGEIGMCFSVEDPVYLGSNPDPATSWLCPWANYPIVLLWRFDELVHMNCLEPYLALKKQKKSKLTFLLYVFMGLWHKVSFWCFPTNSDVCLRIKKSVWLVMAKDIPQKSLRKQPHWPSKDISQYNKFCPASLSHIILWLRTRWSHFLVFRGQIVWEMTVLKHLKNVYNTGLPLRAAQGHTWEETGDRGVWQGVSQGQVPPKTHPGHAHTPSCSSLSTSKHGWIHVYWRLTGCNFSMFNLLNSKTVHQC